MRWFEEEGEGARAVNFREVAKRNRPDMSWARSKDLASAKPALDGASLRPPRVPSELRVTAEQPAPESYVGATLVEEKDQDEVSGLHAAPGPAPREAMAEPVPPSTQDFESLVPHERPRKDTMIDDIVPRAEEEAVAAIKEAVERAAAERTAQFESAEERLVDLALLVARRVIAREVSLDPKIVQGLVREGVSALGERDRMIVRVGTFFAEMKDHLQAELANGKIACEVLIDPNLDQTGCVVETDLGRVDESIETRLSNLIDTLSFDARRKRK